jgi:glycosyltransferase involved in cell wall biosynthesis
LNLTPDAVTVIANGIPPRIADESREAARQRLQIPTDRVAFASVALFEPRKGHRFILEALHQISLRLAAEKIPLMLIEGNGPGREALEKYALELNISPYVRFIGSERNMANLLAASDGFIESSIAASPSPNVVSEAMAVGLPVIASVHSSMDQIEDGQDGILVDPKDTAALSQAVQRLSGSPALRHSLGHAAKATFTHKFSASQASQRYLDLYKEVTI